MRLSRVANMNLFKKNLLKGKRLKVHIRHFHIEMSVDTMVDYAKMNSIYTVYNVEYTLASM